MKDWPTEKKQEVQSMAGIPVPLVDLRVVHSSAASSSAADPSSEVPRDGNTMGEVQLRGPWVAASYYELPDEKDKWTEDGLFRTGDVGTLDPQGYLAIVDRTKDLIKSGGEWISSVDLENALVAHPDVSEAAVIAVPHPKWQERPVAFVVAKDGVTISSETLREFMAGKFAKWQLPDAFLFVDQLPHTSTGKLLKAELRRRYQDWHWER
jgi:fatty-acyl-CoA synthase